MPFARVDGLKVHYEVTGDGPPLVLHPGMFCVGEDWARRGYTPVLRAEHTVIAIDPLGLGASDGPHDPAAYALPRRVAHVTAVLDDLKIKAAACWGYSLGALTVLGMAVHAPERCTQVVAGAWDPVDGFRSGLEHALRRYGLPADTDPFTLLRDGAYADPDQAAVIDAADPEALRANFAAFSADRGLHAALMGTRVPLLMYCGTEDPWHDPMREVAGRVGADFFAVPGADHGGGWARRDDVLPVVRAFLGAGTASG